MAKKPDLYGNQTKPMSEWTERVRTPPMVPLAGIRFPRSMLSHKANERLLTSLGVEIVDDLDAELEDYARAWLATVDTRERDAPSVQAVVDALERADEARALGTA